MKTNQTIMKNRIKYLILLTNALFFTVLNGQNKSNKSYSGNFEGGTAIYSYYENNDYVRIYDGNFSYEGIVKNYEGLKFHITGNFIDNFRNGKWIFEIKNYKSPIFHILTGQQTSQLKLLYNMSVNSGLASNEEIKALQMILKNGSIKEFKTYNYILEGEYKVGRLDGKWIFKIASSGGYGKYGILTDEQNPTITSLANFKDNHLIGDFLFKINEKTFVKGQFNSNGQMTGKWISCWYTGENNFENICEYENGELNNLIVRNTSTGEILSRNINTENKGRKTMKDVLSFWLQIKNVDDFNGIPISKRNYMYKIDKGILKPEHNYIF